MEALVQKFLVAFCFCALTASAAKRQLVTTTDGAAGLILQQVIQEPDSPKRLQYLEMFLERFPKHESFTWALGEAQTHYLAAKDYDKTLRAAETLLQADPEDIYAAQNGLKAAEAKQDASLVRLWAERTSQSALAVLKAPASDATEYARQCQAYAEYHLYAPALQSSDPKLLLATADQLEQKNPASTYLPQLRARLFQLYRQTGNTAKTLAFAEAALRSNPFQPDMLLFLASHYYDGGKDKGKTILYAKRLIDPQTKASPQQVALGRVMLGLLASQDARFADADAHLRAAIPFLDQQPTLKSEALFHLGLANYRIGDPQQDMKRIEEAYKFHAQCATIAGPFQNQAASSAAGIRSQYHLK